MKRTAKKASTVQRRGDKGRKEEKDGSDRRGEDCKQGKE